MMIFQIVDKCNYFFDGNGDILLTAQGCLFDRQRACQSEAK
jgi:hypothetical protein